MANEPTIVDLQRQLWAVSLTVMAFSEFLGEKERAQIIARLNEHMASSFGSGQLQAWIDYLKGNFDPNKPSAQIIPLFAAKPAAAREPDSDPDSEE